MHQTVNKELSSYLSAIETYFPLEPIPIDSSMGQQDFLALFPAELKRAWKEAQAMTDEWNKLVDRIQGKSWVQLTRNHKLIVPHAYKLIVGIKEGNLKNGSSIVVFLSFIDKKIGLFYVDPSASTKNQRPVYNFASSPVLRYPIAYASYFPLTNSQELYSHEIVKEITSFFSEFTLFDNQFADYKVSTIQTEETYYSNIDLFMVYFERGIPAGVPL